MKRIWVLAGIGMLASSFAFNNNVALAAGKIRHRQVCQQRRIHQGVKSGELTRWETLRLEQQQMRIQGAKHHAWSDGVLDPWERVRLNHMQDHASHLIYRYKHNNARRR